MSKLLHGNVLTFENNSPKWMATDNPENWENSKFDAAWRKKWLHEDISYNLNSEGYRTKERDEIDWGNSVVVIGDSCTLGIGVPERMTVSDQLSKRINKPVINLGVAGSSNLFMMYNAAKLIENFTPYAVVVVWSTAERFPRLSSPEIGSTGIMHLGSWDNSRDYINFWVKRDHYLFHDELIKNTIRQLNIKRFLDYVPRSWKNEHDEAVVPWISKDDPARARDNLHPDGLVYKKWANIVAEDFEKNGWMD
ncbi:MAG: hypothetical protein CBB67_005800 [Alteromonadaceae bacterium TMED7]|uniref:hypothetical protein n=1 Tax=Alteromonas sp. TaxID=232 RepID=UPI000B675A4F|nr:hypothetical protein [Alteromonas sp.]MAI37786.1 hypothetical protein [Alteromonas sp.]RPH20477.1 MAG: hypothetical protein CBB67_005800 [Alteromonadaceae bacterium TMED7]|tara:strand:- start:884 stop:1636 length:753 start_codon:yes stop_codon:yes gene_type:complete